MKERNTLLALALLFDGARDLVSPEPLVADAVDHKNHVGRFFVRRGGQCISHVGAGDGDLFEVVSTVAGGFRQQQKSRLISQRRFSTNIRKGFGVRRETAAERILQHLALIRLRLPHYYGRVMRGVRHLDQHEGRVVAFVNDDIDRVVGGNQIIDGAQ